MKFTGGLSTSLCKRIPTHCDLGNKERSHQIVLDLPLSSLFYFVIVTGQILVINSKVYRLTVTYMFIGSLIYEEKRGKWKILRKKLEYFTYKLEN